MSDKHVEVDTLKTMAFNDVLIVGLLGGVARKFAVWVV